MQLELAAEQVSALMSRMPESAIRIDNGFYGRRLRAAFLVRILDQTAAQ